MVNANRYSSDRTADVHADPSLVHSHFSHVIAHVVDVYKSTLCFSSNESPLTTIILWL